MKLKVCGMSNIGNIRELEDQVQPDWMGLIFYPPSPRYVGDQPFPGITDISLRKVGVFVNESRESIQQKVNDFGLSGIQLHGDENVAEVKAIKESSGLEIFKVFKVIDRMKWTELEAYLPWVDYFLFDTYTQNQGGSGQTFDWEILKDYPYEKPIILSGGIDADQVNEILELKKLIPQLAGVDINSRFEVEPGIKNISKVKKFKAQLKKIE